MGFFDRAKIMVEDIAHETVNEITRNLSQNNRGMSETYGGKTVRQWDKEWP